MVHTHIPSGLSETVDAIARFLAPNVVRIRYALYEDWQGEPAIHFRILLSDAGSQRVHLLAVANRVEAALHRVLDFEAMGLGAYFNYRSEAEQAELKCKEWD